MGITDEIMHGRKRNKNIGAYIDQNLEYLKSTFDNETQTVYHNLSDEFIPSDLASELDDLSDEISKVVDKKKKKLKSML